MPRGDKHSSLVTWTDEKKDLLRKLYPAGTVAECEAALAPHKWPAIESKAKKLKVKRIRCNGWSDDHKALVKKYYVEKGAAYVGVLVGRDANTVAKMANKLGVFRYTHWSPEEDAILTREYQAGTSVAVIASLLPGRTALSIGTRRHELSLRRAAAKPWPIEKRVCPPAWTPEEDEVLRQHYPTGKHMSEMLDLLPGRTARAIRARLCDLQITRNADVKRIRVKNSAPLPRKPKASKEAKVVTPEMRLAYFSGNAGNAGNTGKPKKKKHNGPSLEERLRGLPYNHPDRVAFRNRGTQGKILVVVDEGIRPYLAYRNAPASCAA